MANKNLGLFGAEVVLPPTIAISMPVDIPKQIDKRKMSDGSFRWGFSKKHRKWSLEWPVLTKVQLDAIIAIYDLNAILHWQNNDESAVWYYVVATDFSYDSINPIPIPAGTEYYNASMILEEAI